MSALFAVVWLAFAIAARQVVMRLTRMIFGTCSLLLSGPSVPCNRFSLAYSIKNPGLMYQTHQGCAE